MTSRLASRIRRAEHRLGMRGTCRQCGGRGKPYARVEGTPIPDSARCPSCGEVAEILIRYVDETAQGRPVNGDGEVTASDDPDYAYMLSRSAG